MSATRVLQVLGCLDRGGAENMIMSIYRNIDREKLETELSAIRSHGIARTSGEFGVVGVAVPIHYKESVVASIGICLPEFRFGGETQFAVEYNLLEASKKIEEKLSQGIMIQKI